MKKVLMGLFVFLFLFLGAFVEAGFGDINTDEGTSEEVVTEEGVSEDASNEDAVVYGSRDKGIAITKYTKEFYLALGFGFLVLLIVIYFLYKLAAGPDVRWKKPKLIKQ
ncbi:hypothetical protein KAS08_03615 [Candidatus Pacearchaeota archaeon]|nr:hypothetical protein [Candidatus Pacearchaeota archaeon]